MKRMDEIRKHSHMNYSWGYAYANGFVVLAEAPLHIQAKGLLLLAEG
jgi:hypothetical protein